ncbi:M57 family metalloprotease [Algoriphagus sp. NG3]|uniref:M57 family metalloprotease n=1 Tax=Algoriphagus sp. NG3 TaxID=3097546 RepID=UPI002A817F62|nr:M57 family metalloprotease [Algoriphagus sp. NG3]WPR75500.1 M57 family metalloprotease [Algoriphagus sp. NG3]
MKRISFLVGLVIFNILVTVRCSIDGVSPESTDSLVKEEEINTIDQFSLTPELYYQEPEVFEYLKCQGFDLRNVKLYDEHVMIEGDLSIPLEIIRSNIARNSNDPNAQFVVNEGGVVAFSNVSPISFFIDGSVSTINGNWAGAIRTAAQSWQNITNCRVSFNEVFTAAQADIVFYADNSMNLPVCGRNIDGYAAAEFPGGGMPGRWISINRNDLSTTQGNRETVIRHEIGHSLGFRHDDPHGNPNPEPVNWNGCGNALFGANRLRNTPAIETSSIMRKSVDNNVTVNFTSNDMRAARFLYPDSYTFPAINNIAQFSTLDPMAKDIRITINYQPFQLYRYTAQRIPPWSSFPVQVADHFPAPNSNTFVFWLLNVPHGTWKFQINSSNYGRDANAPSSSVQYTVQ